MSTDFDLTLTTSGTETSIYDNLKSLCQKYSEKLSGSGKCNIKKLLFKSYEVLLKKVDSNFTAFPSEWNDEDVLNALYLHICGFGDDERALQVCRKFRILYDNQHTEIYKNSVSAIIRMLYSIAITESDSSKKKKFYGLKKGNWFDANIISESIHNFNKYLPNEDIKFFTLPKIHSSQSDNNLSSFRYNFRHFQLPSSATFDCISKIGNSKQEKQSYDLDEGFVTPSDEHKERSPCMDKKITILAYKSKQFEWDWKVVGVPPREDKSWEKLDLLGRNKEIPFFERQVHLQHWLSKAPHSITKISTKQLIEDVMSLLVGVPSTIFPFNGKTFVCKTGLYTDDHTAEDVLKFTKQYIEAAEAFLALKSLSDKNLSDDVITSAFKLAMKKYLYKYQLMIYHIIHGRNNNKSYLTDVQLLIEQVICLKKILVQPQELKGVALLEQLFRNMETSSTPMFYLLTSLFLQPCLYYFRLIDDWISLGRWHKDLPILPCDFSLIQDRQSWEEAYKPIQNNFLWFIPVQDLAYCGKALSLLRLSKNSEKFLKMLKSNDKPEVKICLHLCELKKLQMECHNFYERAKNTFYSVKEESFDLALCAHNSAKMRMQSFEELKKEKMESEKERKRKELELREEDLIRSAKVRELKKTEQEIENIRVERELEDMLLKEEKRELEKAKEIFSILKLEQAEEEKREFKAEWKLKRQQNNKKRQEFFNHSLIHIEDKSEESVIEKEREQIKTEDSNDIEFQIPVKSIQENTDRNLLNQCKIGRDEIECKVNDTCHKTKHTEFEENRFKVLGSNLNIGNDITSTSEPESKKENRVTISSKVLNLVETNTNKQDNESKYPDLEENRSKILGSNFIVGNDILTYTSLEVSEKNDKISSSSGVMNHIQTTSATLDNDIKYPDLEDNRSKVLGSDFIVGDLLTICKSEEVNYKNDKLASSSNLLNIIEASSVLKDQVPKYSQLEINRMKALHSDFERGNDAALLIYQDEAGKNKNKILGSHFKLGSDVIVKQIEEPNSTTEISQASDIGNKEVMGKDEFKSSDDKELTETNKLLESKTDKKEITESNEVKEGIPQQLLDSDYKSQVNNDIINSSANINVLPIIEEHLNLSGNKIGDLSGSSPEHIGVNGVSWFHKCNQHVEGVKNLFKANDLVNLPEQKLDYCSILRCVPGSLNVVLETQLRLVNEALLEMFFNEFNLLTEAGKLKKYFFLDEEFGKKLSCLLCPAIEKEKPTNLLTFGRLRDVLVFASQGDEKLSFIVKETPNVFDLTNPQVLSCLGLSYKFTWPLNLIFTDIAMSKYNDVFEYMLSLQRVTWHLDQVWLLLKFRSSQMKGHEYTQIQLYRHIMSQFICTLQWYICTTVFENSWQKFNREVKEVSNFHEVYRKHASYLKEVIFKCFLNEKSSGLMKKMLSLLKYVLIFCQVMRFGEWSISETGEYEHCNFNKLQKTFSSFLKLAKYIVRQIEKLVKINYQEDLVHLYNLFTINSFYLTEMT